jgi:hypothetical protein
MTDRLAELVRQRALMQEHLEWLDRQIVEATRQTPTPADENQTPISVVSGAALSSRTGGTTPSSSTVAAAPASLSGVPVISRSTTEGGADEILEQFRVPPDAVRNDVRKGCFLYFGAAFLLLGVVIAVVYFVFRPR